MASQSRLLALPSEVKVLIYRSVFSDLRLTVAGHDQSPNQGPWALLLTCRTCYNECIPIFYELSTIYLKHQAYLYVLQRKIGSRNMNRLQHVAVGGLNSELNRKIVTALPSTLKQLHLEWKGHTQFNGTTPKSHLSDEHIKILLSSAIGGFLNPGVTALFTKRDNLKIYLDAIVGTAPSSKDPASAETSRYAIVRAEIVKNLDGDGWHWGKIERKLDRLMVAD